uniref:Copia protein n=1 Tax=Tanacetum cinerariifolium TaxID=118510 RepID=A0A6L2K8P9_TANCI|nr:copia protein [Tanacetum cinerariifolium]
MKIEESLNVTFDETPPPPKTSPLEDDELVKEESIEDPKTSHLEAVKRIFRYIKGTMNLGLWYPKGSGIETIVYVDSDHVGDYVDRKRTSGFCTFIGCFLTSWFLKKQTALAISTIEAEYVSTRKACQQALWMKQALIDYGVRLDNIPIMCDNKGAIDLSKNLIQHSRTKHIEIRHHFLRDNVQKGNISIENVSSEDNIADILTKPLKRELFNYLRLGNPTNATQQVFKTYRNVKQEIRDQLNAEAEAVQIILTRIDNDIYSTVDACPNACEIWKAIEREQGDKAENKDKGKSHVVTITGFKDLNEEFAECINNSSNSVFAAGSSVSAAELNFTNSTNNFSAASPSNAAMPNLEDLSHNADDVGAEADINNMESIISLCFHLHYHPKPRKVKTHLISSKLDGYDGDPSLHKTKSKAKMIF